MPDETPIPATPDPAPQQSPPLSEPPTPAKPRRRHLIFKAILVLLGGVLVFLALLPTLFSMGWARRIVESKANEQIRGKLSISDWSLGWFTGARIGPIDLTDSSGKPVFQLASINTDLSISDIIRGHYDLGTVPVTGMRLYVTREPDGRFNVQKLLPEQATPRPEKPPEQPAQPAQPSTPSGPSQPPVPSAPKPPSKLPNISVDLELSDCQAVYTDAATGQTVTFPISGSLKIPDINQPIVNDLQVGIQSNNSPTATISLSGSIAAVHDNVLDTNQPAVDETLKIAGLDLSAFKPMVASALTTLAGAGGGEFHVVLTPHTDGSVAGNFAMMQIKAGGKATKGDTFSADAFTITIPKTSLPTAGGPGELARNAGRFTVGGGTPISAVLQQGSSKSTVTLAADADLAALGRIARNQAPGDSGKFDLAANIDLAAIANQLPHLVSLQKGMKLNSATLKADASLTLTASDATPDLEVSIENVAGANGSKAVMLKPITLSASGAIQPSNSGGAPSLKDLKAEFASAFGNGSLEAPILSQISGQFTAQLADAQKELGQIIDFGSTSMSGAIAANISSPGWSGAPANSSAKVDGKFAVTDLHIGRGKSAPIDVPSVNYTLAATLFRNASQSIAKITGFDLSGTVGSSDKPAITTHFSTDLTIGKNSSVVASNVNITNAVNVGELRRELGTAATSDKIPANYTIKQDLGATVAFGPSASSVDIAVFSITDNHGWISVQRAGPADIRFATGVSRLHVPPSGTVAITADLGGLAAVFAPADPKSATLAKGHLDSTIALSGDTEQLQFQEDLHATGMTVRSGQRNTAIPDIEAKSAATYGPGDQLQVGTFSLSGAGAEVHLKQPLVLAASEVGERSIDAELVGAGDIGQIMKVVNAFESSTPPATYAGSFTLDQAVSTVSGVIAVKGGLQANLTITNSGKTAFAEPNVSLVDDLTYDQPHDSATINNFTLDMQNTGALKLGARGTVADLSGTRTMQNLSADLHYDAAALWQLIYATMNAEQRKSYSDVKITGVVDRHFVVSGSYPANEPFNAAVQSLTVQGGIALATFEGKGMSIAKLDLPISLHAGQFFIAEPTPASLNGGTLSLNGATVDLSDPHQRLSIPDNTKLCDNVSLNAVLVQNANGFINNPLLIGADSAAGVLTVIVDHCSRLPTDDLVKATTAENDGTFHMHMVLGKLQIGTPQMDKVTKVISPILGGNFKLSSFQGEIPNYTVEVAKGIMTSDMTMNLSEHKRTMRLNGTVALASQKLNMTLVLPTALFGEGGPLAQLAGDNLTIPITGTVDRPNFDVKSIVQKNFLKGGGKDLGNLLKGLGG